MLRLGKEVKKVEGVEAMTELCKCGWVVTARFFDTFNLRQIIDDDGSVFCGYGKGVVGDVVGLILGRRESVKSRLRADMACSFGEVCVLEHKAILPDGTALADAWDMAKVMAIQHRAEVEL